MHPDRIGSLLILLFCLIYGWLIQDIIVQPVSSAAFSARSLPIFLCLLAGIVSLWILIKPGTVAPQASAPKLFALNWRLGIGFCALMCVYGLSLRTLGFIAGTFGFLFISFYLLGERRYLLMLTIAGIISATFWILMSRLLGIYLPPLPVWLNP